MGTRSAPLYIFLCGTRLFLQEKQARTRKDSGKTESKSNESDSVELRSAFETENFALQYIQTVWNYRQATAENRATHKSVVEMGIYFW